MSSTEWTEPLHCIVTKGVLMHEEPSKFSFVFVMQGLIIQNSKMAFVTDQLPLVTCTMFMCTICFSLLEKNNEQEAEIDVFTGNLVSVVRIRFHRCHKGFVHLTELN